jgi:tRNA(Ile)-lysidine synthetase-like protein
VHPLAQRVLSHIRRQELLRAGDRVGVAVSGGIDSVALLRLMLELRGELGIVLSVVHFNHKLRWAESDADAEFVAELARAHDLEFFGDSDDVAQRAREEGVSVEAAARELRYGFFRYLIGEGGNSPSPHGKDTLSQRTREGWGNRDSGTLDNVKIPTSPKTGEKWGTQSAVPPESASRELKPDSEDESLRGAKAPLFHPLNRILTGHTLDDQAETVLLRMIRGTGMRGLGGIHPRVLVEDDDGEFCGEIIRPLLTTRRCELEQYLKEIGQAWREDSTNNDTSLTRNRVRKLVVPLLEREFNPAVAENLAGLAEIARGEEDYWENEIAGWMGTAVHWSEPEWAASKSSLIQITGSNGAESELRSRIENAPWRVMNAAVRRVWLLAEPVAVQRRLVKAIGEEAGIPLEFKHVEEILRFAAEENAASKELSLPLRWKLIREADALVFVTPDLRNQEPPAEYEYELPVPGRVVVRETQSVFEARLVRADATAGYNPERLLDAEALPGPFRVRNWRPGDRFWPVHTKSAKKIKELLQERHVAQPERRLWPVVVSGDEIIWVRSMAPATKFRARPDRDALLIVENFLAGEGE